MLQPNRQSLWAASCYHSISSLFKLAFSFYLSTFCPVNTSLTELEWSPALWRTWWAMRGPQRPTSPWGGWCTCTTAPSCTHGQSSRSAAPQSCPAWCCRWREEWPFFDSPEFARVLAQPWVVKRSKEQEETINFSPVCTHCCFSTACTLKWGWGNVSCHCSVNKREFRGPLSAVIHKWHPAFKEI